MTEDDDVPIWSPAMLAKSFQQAGEQAQPVLNAGMGAGTLEMGSGR